MLKGNNKWRIDYIRDGLTEEFHEGIFVTVFDKNIDSNPYYLRSCAKPLQATLLLDNGIELAPEELAFCCGSHAGEDVHIEIANNLLKKFGLKESDLKCGIHSPLSRTMQDKMLLRGQAPNQLHNNCSGKHIGFLAICVKNGWDIKTYDSIEHPLQQEIKNKINDLCEVKQDYPITTDGCGVPILSMPLYNLALGYTKLLNYPEIISAIKTNPYIYGGENRLDTEIVSESDNLVAKVGAGGLCVVLNTITSEAFVVKINDCSMEARRVAVLEYLKKLGWVNIEYDKDIKTIAGKKVGSISFYNP